MEEVTKIISKCCVSLISHKKKRNLLKKTLSIASVGNCVLRDLSLKEKIINRVLTVLCI